MHRRRQRLGVAAAFGQAGGAFRRAAVRDRVHPRHHIHRLVALLDARLHRLALFTQLGQHGAVHPARTGRDVVGQLRGHGDFLRHAAVRMMAVDARPDAGDVVPRLGRQAAAVEQIVLQPARPRIVGRQEGRRAVEVVHLTQVGGAGHQVIVGVIGVVTQAVAGAHLGIGAGHQLHQAHGANRAGGAGAAAGFLAHDLAHPALRHVEAARCLDHPGAPGVAGWARRVIAAGLRMVAAASQGATAGLRAGASGQQPQHGQRHDRANQCRPCPWLHQAPRRAAEPGAAHRIGHPHWLRRSPRTSRLATRAGRTLPSPWQCPGRPRAMGGGCGAENRTSVHGRQRAKQAAHDGNCPAALPAAAG